MSQNDLLPGIKNKERRALARAISFIENQPWQSRSLIAALYREKMLGAARVLGITGPPGAGKSTLSGRLVKHMREAGYTVGVILVDPSSPFTGGALLGDRVRMAESNTDPGVFIRSMGSRGHLGGLSLATQDTVSLLDAFGFDYILIETVGIGQAETEIVQTADLTVVIAVPGLGDEIQIIKAGIMEIGDIFVVNKADRDGAEKVFTEINMMLDMVPQGALKPPVLRTVANRDQGVSELLVALEERFRQYQELNLLEKRRKTRAWKALSDSVQQQVNVELQALLNGEKREEILHSINSGQSSPYEEAAKLLELLFEGKFRR